MTPEELLLNSTTSLIETSILGSCIVLLVGIILVILRLQHLDKEARSKIFQDLEESHKHERKEWMAWSEKQTNMMVKSIDEMKVVIKEIAPALNGLENIIIRLEGKIN